MVDISAFGKCVYQVLVEYKKRLPIEALPISVDILRDVVKDRCGLTSLVWRAVDVATPALYGNIKFYYPVPNHIRVNEEPTTAIISYRRDLPPEWVRFVVCKEMCHCLIDTEEDRVSNPTMLLALVEGLASRLSPPQLDGPLGSEQWAEILALELLYPWELRSLFVERHKAGQVTSEQLAKRFVIPTEHAELGMYEYFTAFSNRMRGGLAIKVEPAAGQ